jgi:hypothetical protein
LKVDGTGNSTPWIKWTREIDAVGQIGLHFSWDEFISVRYNCFLDISSTIKAVYSNRETNEYMASFLGQERYATPNVDVRAAVIEGKGNLMVQERSDSTPFIN